MRRTLLTAALAAAVLGGCEEDETPPVAAPPAGTTHVARGAAVPSREQVDAAIARGVGFLLKDQNNDGSWGGPAPTITVDIYAPGPGSHEAYRVATSALAVAALLDVRATGAVPAEHDEALSKAIARGLDYLVAHARVRRTSVEVLYNVWSHAYNLAAFARALAQEKDAARRETLTKAAAESVDMLGRFEYVEGGWGYYDFVTGTRHPGLMATSFTTATVLVALKRAREQGIEVPQRLVDRAVTCLSKMRKPDGSFAYSWDHRYWPQGGINKIEGSLARTPACYRALRDWGGGVTVEQVATAFENLREKGHFLAIARKYPYPHEAFYANSGYFCFYGYYYASLLLDVLPGERRRREAGSMAAYLVPLQEPDGSWWDYQLYRYHKPYGTAYVVMALTRCR